MVLIITALLISVIVAGMIYLLLLFKRNSFDPSQTSGDPDEIILEAMKKYFHGDNRMNPINGIKFFLYIRKHTGMGFSELKKYFDNLDENVIFNRLTGNPDFLENLQDKIKNDEDEPL